MLQQHPRPAEDRFRLIALIRERAESAPEFREFLKTFPEAAGLLDAED
ncbi:hypothetical protein [Nonomuraea terrae]|nr:hypothetical protein [Nonomuraea terrae]